MKTTIIIRKPKFMRDDVAMKTYIDVAATIANEATRPEMTLEQQVSFLKKVGECLNKAAKAGGFRNAGDMYKWLESHS